MDLGWRLEAGGDPFDASTGELPLIFALSFPFIWLIQLLSLGNGLRKRVMYSLSGYIPASSHVHSFLWLRALPATNPAITCAYQFMHTIANRRLLPVTLHIHFVRQAGRGFARGYRSVMVHESGWVTMFSASWFDRGQQRGCCGF